MAESCILSAKRRDRDLKAVVGCFASCAVGQVLEVAENRVDELMRSSRPFRASSIYCAYCLDLLSSLPASRCGMLLDGTRERWCDTTLHITTIAVNMVAKARAPS